MHYFYILTLCICLSLSLKGQQLDNGNWYPYRIDTGEISLVLKEQGRKMDLQMGEWPDIANLNLQTIRLNDADLHVQYDIQFPHKELVNRLIFTLRDEDGRIVDRQSEHFTQNIATDIYLFDVTEKGFTPGEVYQLTLELQLLGKLNCEEGRPEFDLPKYAVPLATTSAGLISLGIGEVIYGKQQRSLYEEYQTLWASGENYDRLLVKGRLDGATNAKETRRIFTWGGAILSFGGTLWYLGKRRAIKRQQAIYDTYCTPAGTNALSFHPHILSSPDGLALGGRIQYAF